MSQLILTMVIAAILIGLALIVLAISLLCKGKSSLHPGSCGRLPTKPGRDNSCGTKRTCHLCETDDEKSDIQ